MKKLFITLLSALAIAAPARADSLPEIKALMELVEATGTKVSANTNSFDKNCIGKAGYYSYKEGIEDVLVVCVDQTGGLSNYNGIWESLAHETTHVMHACRGYNPIFKPKYHAAMLRQLRALTPDYARLVTEEYLSEHALLELEAFWMELQPPSDVRKYLRNACFKPEAS